VTTRTELSELPSSAWNHVDCGLCGSPQREVKFQDGPFSVVTCKACGLTYVTPRLQDGALIAEVYNESYWSSDAAKQHGYTDYRADEPLYLATYRRRLAVVRRHFARPGRVLDVGCAAGYFLRVMRDEGWEVLGLEPSDAIRSLAVERLGPEAVRGGLLGEVELPAASFDLVTDDYGGTLSVSGGLLWYCDAFIKVDGPAAGPIDVAINKHGCPQGIVSTDPYFLAAMCQDKSNLRRTALVGIGRRVVSADARR